MNVISRDQIVMVLQIEPQPKTQSPLTRLKPSTHFLHYEEPEGSRQLLRVATGLQERS